MALTLFPVGTDDDGQELVTFRFEVVRSAPSWAAGSLWSVSACTRSATRVSPPPTWATSPGSPRSATAGIDFPEVGALYNGYIGGGLTTGVHLAKDLGLTGLPVTRVEPESHLAPLAPHLEKGFGSYRLVEGRFGMWAELPVDQVGRLSNHEGGGDELPVVALEQRAAGEVVGVVAVSGRQQGPVSMSSTQRPKPSASNSSASAAPFVEPEAPMAANASLRRVATRRERGPCPSAIESSSSARNTTTRSSPRTASRPSPAASADQRERVCPSNAWERISQENGQRGATGSGPKSALGESHDQ